MSQLTLSHQEIESYLPHRFENVLIDSFTSESEGNGAGNFELNIKSPDPYHRELFTKNNQSELLTPISMEVLALASILSAGKIEEGYVAFFAGISNFKSKGSLSCKNPITGSVKKIGEKGGFYRFSGNIKSETGTATGTVVAFFTEMSKIDEEKTDKKKISIPVSNMNTSIEKPTFKSKDMFLADQLIYLDTENQSITCQYQYPVSHPLTKGHFPNNAIMMGVMQWMMVEDAALVLSKKILSQSGTLNCNATLTKPDGTLVCEIKKATINVLINEDLLEDQAQIASTFKVTFRDNVKPGDILNIHLQVN